MKNLNFDLLKKAAEFLFIPESSLSVIFLLIFIGLFVYGLVVIKNCKKALQEYKDNCGAQYEEERNRINQNQFLSRISAAMAAKEVPVIDLPNMFVSVGILGTFIGLGVAIHGAADLLSADKVDLNKLNEVLNVIAFKFQTSVWGTIFSLVFQKFISEPYFVKKQGLVGEVEKIVYADAVSPACAMEKQLAELKDLKADQKSMDDKLKGLDAHQESMNDKLKGLDAHQESMNDKLQGMNNQQETLNKRLQGMNDHQESINKTFDKFAFSVADTNAKQLKELHNVTNTMAEQNKALVDSNTITQSKLNAELLEKVGSLVESGNMLNMQMTEDVMHKVDKLVGDASDNNATSLNELFAKVNCLVNDSDIAQKVQASNLIHSIAEHLADQKQNIKSMLEKQNELNTALVGDIQSANDDSANFVREGVFQQIEQFKQYAEDLASKQKETQKSLEDKLHALNISLGENSNTSNENIAQLRRAIDVLQKAIDDNSEALKDITDNFYEKQDELDALQRAEIMGFAQSFNTLLNKAGTSTAEWRKNRRAEAPKDDQQ